MLKRVAIANYKSLHDVDLKLEALTILFGSNSAGKSNFLDALQLLAQISRGKSLQEAFLPPHRGDAIEAFTFGSTGMKGLLESETVSFSIEVDVELSEHLVETVNAQLADIRAIDAPEAREIRKQSMAAEKTRVSEVKERYLRYRIEVQLVPRTGVLRIIDEQLLALDKRGQPKLGRNPYLSKVENHLRLRSEQGGRPNYYELGMDHSVLSNRVYAPLFPHLVAMRQEIVDWFFFYLEPRERMRIPGPVKEATSIGSMGEDLAAFLNTLRARNPRQFLSLRRTVTSFIPTIEDIAVELDDMGRVILLVREQGRDLPASVVSEGTLRIIGLLALLSSSPRPSLIGFEEPENGIHPKRLRLIADLLKERSKQQSTTYLITTHSPSLIDLFPESALFAVSKHGGFTDIVPFKSTSQEGLFRQGEVTAVLDQEGDVRELKPSERVIRGDFDAA